MDSIIIFVTDYVAYAPEGYEFQAFRNLLKTDAASKLEEYLHQGIQPQRLFLSLRFPITSFLLFLCLQVLRLSYWPIFWIMPSEPEETIGGKIAPFKHFLGEYGYGVPSARHILRSLNVEFTFHYANGYSGTLSIGGVAQNREIITAPE